MEVSRIALSELDWDFCFDGHSTVYSGVRKDAVTETITQQRLKHNLLKKFFFMMDDTLNYVSSP